MKKMLVAICGLLLISSCSLFQNKEGLQTYENALTLNKEGKVLEAKAIFVQSCNMGIQAACHAVGKAKGKIAKRLSILQGATTDDETQIVLVLPKGENYFFNVWDGNVLVKAVVAKDFQRDDSDWKVKKVYISGLKTGVDYRLEIVNRSNGDIEDERTFQSLKTKGKKLDYFVASCMSDYFHKEQEQMWTEAFEQVKPEVIFIIGDAVYADWINNKPVREGANPQQLWMRFQQGWNSYLLMRKAHLVPTYGVWDDHDYGKNNGGMDFQYKNQAKEIFQTFFAQTGKVATSNITQGHGVGFALKLRNQMFYFLDNRSFRSGFKDVDGTHIGEAQEKWLYSLMKKNSKPSWLIMGDQFFGAYHRFESFEGLHKTSFKKFIKKLKSMNRRVMFITGDRHLTEIMKIEPQQLGYTTYELTSSGIHTKVYPGTLAKEPNSRGIEGADGKLNYMFVKTNAISSKHIKFDVSSYTQNKELLFSRKLEVK